MNKRTTGPASHRRDDGSALLMVMATMSIMIVLVSTALTFALQTQSGATASLRSNQALAAAQAGVDDYVARLNRNDLYWKSVDCTNFALQRADLCPGKSTGWLTVPSSRGSAYPAEFHYDVTTADTAGTGTISLISTGRSGSTTRSIKVTLQRAGFGEYLYFTDYETIDPADRAAFPDRTVRERAATACPRHYYDTPGRGSDCEDLSFISQDTIDGPLHSNDALLITGSPTFNGAVSTSYPSCKPSSSGVPRPPRACYRPPEATPKFTRGISYHEPVEIDDTISELRQYVTGRSDNLGCLYTGPTRIRFLTPAVGATPRMKVWSKWSTSVNPGCGTPGTATGRLGSSGGQELDVPTTKLILVQDVPSSQSAPASGRCANGEIGDGLPQANDVGPDFSQYLPEWDCRTGTVFVQGTLGGRLSIAADNTIVITGDLDYANGKTGDDALGLMAVNSVKLYHPINSSGSNIARPWGGTFTNPTVQASILTLQHSFGNQLYEYGDSLGTINLYGAIAQRYRGAVGTFYTSGANKGKIASGYAKNYSYDARLRYSPPPYFLSPVKSAWRMRTFGEVAGRYRTP